jgi:hypothetical protein
MNALKRYSANGALWAILSMGLGAALAIGCTTTTTGGAALTPTQQAINAGTTSYQTLDQAILAADAAVKAGALKGQDARNALTGFTAAKAGLDTGLAALRSANAAAAAASATGGK